MTKILIRILFLAAVVGGGVFYSKQNQIVQNSEAINDLEYKKNQFQGSVKGIADGITNQAQELSNRSQEVGEHVSNILGSYIQPTEEVQNNSTENNNSNGNDSSNSQNKPIYEETLDYGRYLYCQQVIEDYDNQHP